MVRGGNLCEADFPGGFRHRFFVRGKAIAMHENDGASADAGIEGRLQTGAGAVQIQRRAFFAVRRVPPRDLQDPLVQHFGQLDIQLEQMRAGLITDSQGVMKAVIDDQQGTVALAFQQSVGAHRGAHLDRGNAFGGDGIGLGHA